MAIQQRQAAQRECFQQPPARECAAAAAMFLQAFLRLCAACMPLRRAPTARRSAAANAQASQARIKMFQDVMRARGAYFPAFTSSRGNAAYNC